MVRQPQTGGEKCAELCVITLTTHCVCLRAKYTWVTINQLHAYGGTIISAACRWPFPFPAIIFWVEAQTHYITWYRNSIWWLCSFHFPIPLRCQANNLETYIAHPKTDDCYVIVATLLNVLLVIISGIHNIILLNHTTKGCYSAWGQQLLLIKRVKPEGLL